MRTHLLVVVATTLFASAAHAAGEALTLGVISQRSLTLTAQYWNPILDHVSRKSGITLELKLARTGEEHAAQVARGDPDFIYSNHNFTPENDGTGYQVIARMAHSAISGQIVVLAKSAATGLKQLRGKEVVFPSRAAFVGYYVPMDALLRQGIEVSPLFAGNQEGAMAQLKAGRAVAAAVNSEVMRDFARREGLAYRVLWSSEPFKSIPISVHPRIDRKRADAVRTALVQMVNDPAGARILAKSAAAVKQEPPYGFVSASDADYENVRRFHKTTKVKGD